MVFSTISAFIINKITYYSDFIYKENFDLLQSMKLFWGIEKQQQKKNRKNTKESLSLTYTYVSSIYVLR